MKLLDRYLFKELVGPFLFGVAAFSSIMFAGRELFKITELVAEYNAPLYIAIELIALFLPSIIVLTLPMSMLLCTLLGFGRLSGDSEAIALFASGISLFRIAVPAVILACVVTVAGFVLSEDVAPQANLEHDRIMRSFNQSGNASADKPFIAIDSDGNITRSIVFVQGGIDASTGRLRKVSVIQFKDNKPIIFIYAEEAVWVKPSKQDQDSLWEFYNGYYNTLGTGNMVVAPFDQFTTRQVRIYKTPEEMALYQMKPSQMSFDQLRKFIAMLKAQGQDVTIYRVQLYQKISTPLACIVFTLIGIPLGLRPHRSSSAIGLGLSIVIIFAYWVLMHYMTILGNNGVISPAASAFIPVLVGTAIGVFLIMRAAK